MAKRKSPGPGLDRQEPPTGVFPKRAKTRNQLESVAAPVNGSPAVDHALLKQYYSQTTTLRDHLLASLPAASRLRRRKIASVGRTPPSSSPTKQCTEAEIALARLLDTTLVASRGPLGSEIVDENKTIPDLRWEQWIRFSQRGADESYVTLADGLGGSLYSQAEIVDFVIWLLYSREKPGTWPKHLLCDGFKRRGATRGDTAPADDAIPGLFVAFPNQRVRTLKTAPWPQLLMLLGKEGERIMIDLLVDHAIFETVQAGRDNLYQLSGVHIAELKTLAQEAQEKTRPQKSAPGQRPVELRPSELFFLRNRMLYARAALNAHGLVQFGLRHIHVLNRCPLKSQPKPDDKAGGDGPPMVTPSTAKEEGRIVHIMMYMFPRQFGLHNVFTSLVDRRQTAQQFMDYTLREEEINQKFPKEDAQGKPHKVHIPKRLRGETQHLVERLMVLHGRCSYSELLQHYCPIPEKMASTQRAKVQTAQPRSLPSSRPRPSQKIPKKRKKASQPVAPLPPPDEPQYETIVELATPLSSVSAFCQAVLSKIIPDEFWGRRGSEALEHNKKCFLRNVHHFIHLRRFEGMCLHEATQGLKITDMEWLAAPGKAHLKCSQSETHKRAEILSEFLYYLFDSLLIPLIRSNFYVTESSVHKTRLFFFRHDVWRHVAEPAMASLRATMFEEVPLASALHILSSRRLGAAQIRLLPKQTTMRPIMNLRRRTLLPTTGPKPPVLGPSINSVLLPVHSALKLERTLRPASLGAGMFSVSEIYPRLKAFKARLPSPLPKLYLAKVDVKAAFDTIPQRAVLAMLETLPTQSHYRLTKHVEVRPLVSAPGKATRRWHSTAHKPGGGEGSPSFVEALEAASATAAKKDTVFVDGVARARHEAKGLVALAREHVERNLVRVGKKYYRQREGIPQGSVLSSMLCNWFYARMEGEVLGFLGEEGLMMRLIDDFLLVTTDEEKARRFVRVMRAGVEAYGVRVSEGKTVVNFDMGEGEREGVKRIGEGERFPYCGLEIDCRTLEVGKAREGGDGSAIFNSLTVDFSRTPGQNFTRKVLNAFKVQSHLIFFDTSHNSRPAVLKNLYTALVETATKTWAYTRCLPAGKKPSLGVLTETIKTLINITHILLTSRSRMARYPGYVCSVRKGEVAWLALVAFHRVFAKKQAGYKGAMAWLERELGVVVGKRGGDFRGLGRLLG